MSEKPPLETGEVRMEAEYAEYRRIRTLYEQNEQWKKNIWGPEEWENYGVELTPEQLEKAKDFPWRPEILTSPDPFAPQPQKGEAPLVIDTHMAPFLPGRINLLDKGIAKEDFTLKELHKLEPDLFYSKKDPWFAKPEQDFGTKDREEGWRLIRKEVLPGSLNQTFFTQVAMLLHPGLSPERGEVRTAAQEIERRIGRRTNESIPDWNIRQAKELGAILKGTPYEIPTPREEADKEIFYALKNKERLNKEWYARTRFLGSDGGRVHVGDFRPDGLSVDLWFDDDADSSIGLASARKFQK